MLPKGQDFRGHNFGPPMLSGVLARADERLGNPPQGASRSVEWSDKDGRTTRGPPGGALLLCV